MDNNQPKAIEMLHYYGFLTRSDPTIKQHVTEGRADIIAVKHGKAVAIEVKNGKDGFIIGQENEHGAGWKPSQREWAKFVAQFPYSLEYYIYLTLGVSPPSYNPDKYLIKRTWLIPAEALFDTLDKVSLHQKTLPYMAKPKGRQKHLFALGLDAMHCFKAYQLEWAKNGVLKKDEFSIYNNSTGGFWIIPKHHGFYKYI